MKILFLAACCLFLVACAPAEPPAVAVVPVHELAERGQTVPLMAALARAGGEVDRRDVCYRTPLMLAAQFGRLDTVRALLDAGAVVDLQEKGRYTALMLAAGNGHTDVVQVLIAAGANVDNVEVTRGWTALIWAAKRGHASTVRVLLAAGAEQAIGDDRGLTARAWAEAEGHQDVLPLFDRHSARG